MRSVPHPSGDRRVDDDSDLLACRRSPTLGLHRQAGDYRGFARDRLLLAGRRGAGREPFDAPVDGAPVDETLANGYTYQGRLIRPAVVRLRNENETAEAAPMAIEQTTTETASQTSEGQENELPLG